MPNTEKDNSIDICKELLKKGVNPNTVDIIYKYDRDTNKGNWIVKYKD